MLFKKKEYRFCVNCERAAEFDEDHMLCIKKGIVGKEKCCFRFRYDPIKRMPPSASRRKPEYEAADFSL